MSKPGTNPIHRERPGVVVIGRNEGLRLVRCLQSVLPKSSAVIYVDSGSTDGSVEQASRLGADVVQLDLSTPFTAARARNAGLRRLLEAHPDLMFVQFVDGDCEIAAGWMERATAELTSAESIGVVCGRRRERQPNATVYNALCDIEWNTPVGEASTCGGDALIRVAALRQVGGYNDSLIAGEEPEMCLRLRRAGWRILRIDAEMTLHDAAMSRFSQWWKRAVRAGHAYAEGAAMHGSAAERFRVREVRSNWFWGLALPLAALALAVPTRGLSVAVWALAVCDLVRRVRGRMLRRDLSSGMAFRYAVFVAIGKLPQAWGQLRYRAGEWTGSRSRVIEYKS